MGGGVAWVAVSCTCLEREKCELQLKPYRPQGREWGVARVTGAFCKKTPKCTDVRFRSSQLQMLGFAVHLYRC